VIVGGQHRDLPRGGVHRQPPRLVSPPHPARAVLHRLDRPDHHRNGRRLRAQPDEQPFKYRQPAGPHADDGHVQRGFRITPLHTCPLPIGTGSQPWASGGQRAAHRYVLGHPLLNPRSALRISGSAHDHCEPMERYLREGRATEAARCRSRPRDGRREESQRSADHSAPLTWTDRESTWAGSASHVVVSWAGPGRRETPLRGRVGARDRS
jgi:hypothetical protein